MLALDAMIARADAETRADAGETTRALLAVGAPRCGKTSFAVDALMRGLERFGDTGAAMSVSNRVVADRLGDRVIRRIGASAQVRPMTTLSAVAFRIIAARRFAEGLRAPRLLNGAEQDALLRGVLGAHLAHAVAGDLCGTCMMLRDYFASDDWAASVGLPEETSSEPPAQAASGATAAMFEHGISSSLVDQLRDMLARMDELGVGPAHEEELVHAGADLRLGVQWRLAFALRREYAQAVRGTYQEEYRLDSSRLLVEATAALADGAGASHGVALPRLLVVDDFQDTTLAGLRFLEALAARGTLLVLTGNPDESVQTFRGSYPEHLFRQAREGRLRALEMRLDRQEGRTPAATVPDYRTLVAARVSLSIPSPEEEPDALPERAGKLPTYPGAWPLRQADSALVSDGSLHAALYRTPAEELDDVVWRIKRMRLDGGASWNDMAVIAHDNGTVRAFGERLRRDGVPVRYSSVTRALKDEPFVQGLFALVELALLRREGPSACRMDLAQAAAFAKGRVETLMACPLITTGAKPGEGRPARIEPIVSAMQALASLADIVKDAPAAGVFRTDLIEDAVLGTDDSEETARRTASAMSPDGIASDGITSDGVASDGVASDDEEPLHGLMAAWRTLQEEYARTHPADGALAVDDSLTAEIRPEAGAFGMDAQYAMLAFDAPCAPAADVLAAIGRIVGGDPQLRAFQRVWRLVDRVAAELGRLDGREPQFALAVAWNAVGVDRAWQREALVNTDEGRVANDRLDTAMRLFQYAESGAAGRDVVAFIAQVRSMQIEADSLAHVAPVERAVTLTTPAGACGRHWKHVWMPSVQQDVWPNLAERATLFGGEDLADVILHGRAASGTSVTGSETSHDPHLASVLSSEKKSLLVALTRADETVSVSAVLNDDLAPSDFLYGYLPERFDRERDQKAPRYTVVGGAAADSEASDVEGADMEDGLLGALDADPRGLVAAARAVLTRAPEDSGRARDAAAALALLARNGVPEADPAQWTYPPASKDAAPGHTDLTNHADLANHTDLADHAMRKDHAAGSAAVAETPERAGGKRGEREPEKTPTVTLSPSSVDGLWGCPVCWMMGNRFAGPRAGSAAGSFGTLIHKVAQLGSEQGLDRPDHLSGAPLEERREAVAEALMDLYRELRPDPNQVADPVGRYALMRKDDGARDVLGNIADYFTGSHGMQYLGGNVGNFEVGELERAECEVPFTARFSLRDILKAYNAVPGVRPASLKELHAFMGMLVGGWPEGMSERLVIRLSGRIDRKETRILKDGSRNIRLIDYKTGAPPSVAQIVNDLQLVCYQLGLAYDEHGEGPEHLPRIGQSMLFHVSHKAAPAEGHSAPEGLHQPPLFTAGSLNAEPFTPRYYHKNADKILDMPAVSADTVPPQVRGVVDEEAWRGFAALNGSQTLWALTMIARVFHAGASLRSADVDAHPTEQHLRHCAMQALCPACAQQIDTVLETRQA